jgi:WD domain, G-beta repeat
LWPGIRVFDLADGTERFRLGEPDYEFETLAATPDGRFLLSGGFDYAIRVWEVASGQAVLTLPCNHRRARTLAVAPHSRVVASSDQFDGYPGEVKKAPPRVRLWDLATGKQLTSFEGLQSEVRVVAFSPDGAFLAAALADSTILVWPVPETLRRPRLSVRNLTVDELERLWADLGGDAAVGYRAVRSLAGSPTQAIHYLRRRLQPVKPADGKQVAASIAELGSDQFDTRETAARDLERFGAQIEPALQQALKDGVPLETRRRIQGLLKAIDGVPSAEILRVLRAVHVLELIDIPASRPVLEAIASGAPAALETRAAGAALRRLHRSH